jgi:hypothetical protein
MTEKEAAMDTTTIPTTNENWLITPAALAFAERPPASILDQKWLLVLTGIAIEISPGETPPLETPPLQGATPLLQGATQLGWTTANFSFIPDVARPLNFAISKYGIPRPAPSTYDIGFAVDHLASFVSLSAIWDHTPGDSPGPSIDTGYAVNSWHQNTYTTGFETSFKDGAENIRAGVNVVDNIFAGINVDVGVRDDYAQIISLAYNITLRGRIVFTLKSPPSPPPPLEDS